MRLRDAVLTVILWAGFIYLMRDVFSVGLSFFGIPAPWGLPFYDESLPAVLRRLGGYSVVILADTFVLLAWARYNQLRFGRRNRRRRSDPISPAEIGRFFALAPGQVVACQSAKRSVMTHDEKGRLTVCDAFGHEESRVERSSQEPW